MLSKRYKSTEVDRKKLEILQFHLILNTENLMLSKRYESTEIDHKTWLNHTFDTTLVIFLCHDVSTLPLLIDMEINLDYTVKDFVPRYTQYVRPVGLYRRFFNVI